MLPRNIAFLLEGFADLLYHVICATGCVMVHMADMVFAKKGLPKTTALHNKINNPKFIETIFAILHNVKELSETGYKGAQIFIEKNKQYFQERAKSFPLNSVSSNMDFYLFRALI